MLDCGKLQERRKRSANLVWGSVCGIGWDGVCLGNALQAELERFGNHYDRKVPNQTVFIITIDIFIARNIQHENSVLELGIGLEHGDDSCACLYLSNLCSSS